MVACGNLLESAYPQERRDSDMSRCVVCGMWLYERIGEPASAHGAVDNGRCSGWLEPTVSGVTT